MKPLGSWTVLRLLLVGAAVFVASVVLCVAAIILQATWNVDIGPGSGGIGAVSVGINAFVVAIPFVPPLLLLALWLKARRAHA
jgi:hypothetical protein